MLKSHVTNAHREGVCQIPAVSIITPSARVAEPSLYICVQETVSTGVPGTLTKLAG